MRHRSLDNVFWPDRTCEEALQIVGLSRDGCRTAIREVSPSARGYLVGSLAFGLGNARSDVDIHVFVDSGDGQKEAVTRLSWPGGVTVDLDVIQSEALRELISTLASLRIHATPLGACAIAGGPPRATRRRLSRWLNALPIGDETVPLIPSDVTTQGLAWLRRDALETALVSTALALLASYANLTDSAKAYFWQRASTALAELLVRREGDVTTGEKWLRAVSQRHAIPWPSLQRPDDAHACWERLGMPFVTSVGIVEATEATGNLPFTLEGRSGIGSRQGTVTGQDLVTGCLDQIMADGRGLMLLKQVASGHVDLSIQRHLLDKELLA